MNKLLEIIKHLRELKFSGEIIITFNQGGIRGIKKAEYEQL